MSISTQEITEGQNAYQRVKSYEINRHRTNWWFVSPAVISLSYALGHPEQALYCLFLYILLFPFGAYLQRHRTNRYRKDLALLEQLRAKYGSLIGDDIRKEPSSWHHLFCVKRFPEWSESSSRFHDPFPN
jgi:hypothetical protein